MKQKKLHLKRIDLSKFPYHLTGGDYCGDNATYNEYTGWCVSASGAVWCYKGAGGCKPFTPSTKA